MSARLVDVALADAQAADADPLARRSAPAAASDEDVVPDVGKRPADGGMKCCRCIAPGHRSEAAAVHRGLGRWLGCSAAASPLPAPRANARYSSRYQARCPPIPAPQEVSPLPAVLVAPRERTEHRGRTRRSPPARLGISANSRSPSSSHRAGIAPAVRPNKAPARSRQEDIE